MGSPSKFFERIMPMFSRFEHKMDLVIWKSWASTDGDTLMAELFDALEAVDPADREAALFANLVQGLKHAKQRQPLWKERLHTIDPDAIVSREALARVPILRKSDLYDLQRRDMPFGGLNATPPGRLARLFMSPGPLFEAGSHSLDWWGTARALFAAGVRAGQIVLNTFSYHLTPAGAMFESGAHALGCAVIPAGTANVAQQLEAIVQYRPDAYVGTPDFLKILLDKAAESGRDGSSIRRAVVSGAALPVSLKSELHDRGLTVRQVYGTAELGIVAYETNGPGLVVNEGIILEIAHVGTGEPVRDGEVGEVIVTRVNADYPLFRFATGDLSRTVAGSNVDGRTNMRIEGWLGRADQTAKVRGMFIRPEQISAMSQSYPDLGRLRLVISREGERDVLTLLAEHTDGSVKHDLSSRFAALTNLRADIEIVAPGSLPADAKIIVDQRTQGSETV
jgi:phenylacetate-CoA ligase